MDLKQLNAEQKRAITYTEGPMLVVAGAGTGKTKVITQRIAWLIKEHKISPDKILAITFTEKAAEEMQQRVNEQMGQFTLDVKISTFNSFGDSLLKRFAYELGLTPDVKVMSEIQQLIFLRQHIEELELKYYSPVTNPDSFLSDLTQYFSQLKNHLITAKDYRRFLTVTKNLPNEPAEILARAKQVELCQAYECYLDLCRRHNVIDFDDQLFLSVELLQTHPDVLLKLQREIEYILVDEFQDTNRAQSELIDLLGSKLHNVMVVGDDDQCIYRFRGAEIENILQFEQRYPAAKALTLVKNYRSAQAILDSAHHLIEYNNPDRLEALHQINKNLIGSFKGEAPQLHGFDTYEAEAQWIAKDITLRLKNGEAASDIAILIRKNTQARILEQYLKAAEIEHIIVGQNQDLYRQPAVQVMLNFLRYIVDPYDSQSLYHLLTSEVFKVQPDKLRNYSAQANREHQNLADIILRSPEADEELIGIIEKLQQWRRLLAELNVGRLAYDFLAKTNYLKSLLARAEKDVTADLAIASLNQYFTSLLEYERIAEDRTAVGYVAALGTLLGAGERLATDDLPELFINKVRIISVHRAKGLEFQTVYIFDLTQGTFPSINRHESLEVPPELLGKSVQTASKTHLQEERRLMYVAMTRAKRNLIFTYSLDHGGKQAKKPSIFLTEALGQVVLSGGVKSQLTRTAQIELFARKEPVSQAQGLGWWQGEQMQLTSGHIETYLMCPAEFKLRYILNPPTPPTFSLEYGSLMHSCFQMYNQAKLDGKSLSLKTLTTHLRNHWPKEGFLSSAHSKRALEQAISTITRFYKREEAALRHPKYVERPFEVNYQREQLKLIGRFDAVYDDEQGVEIRDYKTGAANITDEMAAQRRTTRSNQLAIYALAWRQLHGKIPEVVSLDFVDAGFIGTAKKTDRQLVTMETKIKEVATKIRSGDFTPGSSHQFCTHMEYGF